MGSTSGTFVNDQRLSSQGVASGPVELFDGDQVQLGEDYKAKNGKFFILISSGNSLY